MSDLVSVLARGLWSAPVLAALFAAFFEISRRARFPQRRLPRVFGRLLREGGIRALGVQLSAVLGVGNITGMAMAVCLGGPGAVVWCFLAGLLGSGVQYAESLVCLKSSSGGPMHVLRAQGFPRMAKLYACAVCLCGLLIGAAIPSGAAVQIAFPALSARGGLLCGAALCALSAIVILGGRSRVQAFCAKLVPFLVLVYLALLGAILCCARGSVLSAARFILKEAFSLRPALSGLGGWSIAKAMRWGTARGLFSSEAGMGTAGIAAQPKPGVTPERRALACACCAVIDTMLLSSLTGLAFTAAALETGAGFADAGHLLRAAFSLVPYAGNLLVALCVGVLAFSTILGWYFIASRAYAFLFPKAKPLVLAAFWLAAVCFGPCILGTWTWELCDILTFFLLVPNLIALWLKRKEFTAENPRCT